MKQDAQIGLSGNWRGRRSARWLAQLYLCTRRPSRYHRPSEDEIQGEDRLRPGTKTPMMLLPIVGFSVIPGWWIETDLISLLQPPLAWTYHTMCANPNQQDSNVHLLQPQSSALPYDCWHDSAPKSKDLAPQACIFAAVQPPASGPKSGRRSQASYPLPATAHESG